MHLDMAILGISRDDDIRYQQFLGILNCAVTKCDRSEE